MEAVKHYEKAIVGFFDILGYGSFLKNTDSKEAITQVLHLIDTTPDVSQGFFKEISRDWVGKPILEDLLDQVKTMVFSDSIVHILPYSQENDNLPRKWSLFVAQTKLIERRFFDEGLPIRGSIAFGACSARNNCFAGRAIWEARQAEKSIVAAAVALASSAEVELERILSKERITGSRIHDLGGLVEYQLPEKQGTAKRYVVDFVHTGWYKGLPLDGDEKEIVERAFQKHGKEITSKEETKVTNTADLLRFLKSRN